MPFVEGETLRARLEREKQLPVDEAIRIGVAIANALEYAHAHGVIHRDLKPENILLQSGQPVVADFGIALAVSKAGGARITQTGLSLGTPQYMSPEQATGDRVIDGRSDIYSLAAMTYEMLAGEPPHSGTTAQAVIARVLTDRPRPLRSTRSAVPDHVEAALERALEKLPADRFGSAREFAEALQGRGAVTHGGTHARATQARAAAARSWRSRLTDPLTIGLGVVALGATVAAITFARLAPEAAPTRAIRFVVAATDSVRPEATFPWPAAISPDGSMIAFGGKRGGKTMLYLLRTDQVEARPIAGTDGGSQPVFSPDGQWLAFEQRGVDKKVRLDGSSPVRIANGGADNGADWTVRDELVLGSQGTTHGLSKVSVSVGDLVEFTKVDSAKGERDHLWPIATPDGSAVVYVKSDGAVMATPLDLARKRVTGNPVSVHDPVVVIPGNNGNSSIFVSRGGALVTMRGAEAGQLTWIARDGALRSVTPDIRSFFAPRLSPDGRRIAVVVKDASTEKTDAWIYDLGTATLSRVTSLESVSNLEWTRDGKNLLVTSAATQDRSAFWLQPVGGGVAPTKLGELSELALSATLAPDGSALLATVLHENTWSVMKVPLAPKGATSVFVDSKGTDWGPRFSPDGKWVAMVSDESGRFEVYIRSYPEPSARVQVSDAGGGSPSWSPDGKRLYYNGGGAVIGARLELAPALRVVARDTIFRAFGELDATTGALPNFDVAADGSRAVVVRPTSTSSQLVASPNWLVEFRQRMGEANRKK